MVRMLFGSVMFWTLVIGLAFGIDSLLLAGFVGVLFFWGWAVLSEPGAGRRERDRWPS